MIYLFNTLKDIWEKNNRIHEELFLEFNNKELVSFRVEPTDLGEIYTKEVVQGIVNDLVNLHKITFFDDVPQMIVGVPIWEIGVPSEQGNENNPYYIETFHHDIKMNSLQDDRDEQCDYMEPLHEYLWLEKEINVTDMLVH
jgi:hypothetical protein